MRIGIIGTGFVAALYARTMRLHPSLTLACVADRDRERAEGFASHFRTAVRSPESLLTSPDVDIVLNLTNPSSHYAVTRQALLAGKHVYTEKPLAMEYGQAEELVELAERRCLHLAAAPCNLLSETAQTLWRALRERQVGRVHLAYAELEDGLVHRMPYRKWTSEAGAPWPWKDEFEVGCTLEHAGYYLSWLAAFFGPARQVTAFAKQLVEDKLTDERLNAASPDFSVACITFDSGVVARLTCGIVAPHQHRLQIIGERGVLSVDNSWQYKAPVYLRRHWNVRRRGMLSPLRRRLPLLGRHLPRVERCGSSTMDYARGVAEMAEAIGSGRSPRLGGRFALHVTELALMISGASGGQVHTVRSSFSPMAPMPWAAGEGLGSRPQSLPPEEAIVVESTRGGQSMQTAAPRRVLVTGAGGFLGRHVVAALAEAGHTVRAMVRPDRPAPSVAGNVRLCRADLMTDDLTDACNGVDVVVHLAAQMLGDDAQRIRTAEEGTRRLLEATRQASVRRLVLASSFSVYDWRRVGAVLDEASPLEEEPGINDRDGYAIAKWRQERLVRAYAGSSGCELFVLRPGHLWGPGRLAVPDLGQGAGPAWLVMTPGAVLKLTYVENCAEAFALAAVASPDARGTYNIVDGTDVTAWQYALRLRRHGMGRRLIIPLSYNAVLWATRCASTLAGISIGRTRLPSLLVPCRFEARFKPVHCPNDHARWGLRWNPRHSFGEAFRRSVAAQSFVAPSATSTADAEGVAIASAAPTAVESFT